MAQQYTKLWRTIWNDEDFLALPFDSKAIYKMLISQPDINAAGVLGLRLKRWTQFYPDRTQGQIAKALTPLVVESFIIIDENTEEVLVRSFIVHDGGWKQTNGLRSIENAKRGVLSPTLRRLIDQCVANLPRPTVPPTPPPTVPPTVDPTPDSTVSARVFLEPLTSNLEPSSSSPTALIDDDETRSAVLSLAAQIAHDRRQEPAINPQAWIAKTRQDMRLKRQEQLTAAIHASKTALEAAERLADTLTDAPAHVVQPNPKPVNLDSARVFGSSVAKGEIDSGCELDPDGFRTLCFERPAEWVDAAFDAYRDAHAQIASVTVIRPSGQERKAQ